MIIREKAITSAWCDQNGETYLQLINKRLCRTNSGTTHQNEGNADFCGFRGEFQTVREGIAAKAGRGKEHEDYRMPFVRVEGNALSL